MPGVLVTGLGIITSLGDSVESNRQALIGGHCGISNIELFSTRYAGHIPVGEIKHETFSLKEKLGIRTSGVTRTGLLALHACREAINDSSISNENLRSVRTALIAANTVGGMCLTDELYKDANRKEKGSEYLASYDGGSVTLFLQDYFQINGWVDTINTACSSSANAIMHGARLIKNGLADRVIAGGVDSLAKFTINGFNALHILAPELCTPFDKDRKGLNLGEGAAFLVLEKEEDLNGRKAYGEVKSYCNANDAFHPSSLSENGEGPFRAMMGAIQGSGLSPEDIDYINAHGTATENNDLVEGIAMQRVFKNVPAFSSTKSNTGHTLGGAGAVEALFSILSLHHGELYPHLRFKDPVPETGLIPVTKYSKQNIRHVMSNSFGFGGNCTSLIFSKFQG